MATQSINLPALATEKRWSFRAVFFGASITALVSIGLIFTLFPFAWTLFESLKPEAEVMEYPPRFFYASQLTLDNYFQALEYASFGKYVSNTLAYALTVATLTVVT